MSQIVWFGLLKVYDLIAFSFSSFRSRQDSLLAVKMLIEYRLQSLREQLHHIRGRLVSCRQISVVFPHGPLQLERSSEGRLKYHITAEQFDVLRSTGMSWTGIANCLGVGAKTL